MEGITATTDRKTLRLKTKNAQAVNVSRLEAHILQYNQTPITGHPSSVTDFLNSMHR